MIKSAQQSSIQNDIKYRSMSAGNVPSNEYLISTTVVGATPAASVEFDVSAYAGIYRHLQLVFVSRGNRSGAEDSNVYIQFNGDTGANYNSHYLRGNGSVVESGAYTSSNNNGVFLYQGNTGSTQTSNSFAANVVDILDPFNSNKFTTVRNTSGMTGALNRVFLHSGAWRNTASLTLITLDDTLGNFTQYSRFSLYGVV